MKEVLNFINSLETNTFILILTLIVILFAVIVNSLIKKASDDVPKHKKPRTLPVDSPKNENPITLYDTPKRKKSRKNIDYKEFRETYFTKDTSGRKYYLDDDYFTLMILYNNLNSETIYLIKDDMNNLIEQNRQKRIDKVKQLTDIKK